MIRIQAKHWEHKGDENCKENGIMKIEAWKKSAEFRSLSF